LWQHTVDAKNRSRMPRGDLFKIAISRDTFSPLIWYKNTPLIETVVCRFASIKLITKYNYIMKKLGVALFVLLFGLSMVSMANDNVDKFVGKWKLQVRDLPDGDAEMTLVLNLNAEELSGKLIGEDKEEFPLYDIEIAEKELIFMYDARGYNVSVAVELIEEGKCEGYMMDMFLIEGEKMKEEKGQGN